jgi:polysaccharide export outer membrane protein
MYVFSLAVALSLGLAPCWGQAAGGGAGAGGAAAGAGGGVGGSSVGPAISGQNGPSGSGNSANSGTRTSQNNTHSEREDAADRRTEVPAGSQDTLTEFQQMVQNTTGRRVPIFGASLFNGVPSTFAPVEDVPVGSDYVIGPGDEINVQTSGQVNQKLDLTVDRSGAIQVPGIGAVQVAGLRYGQLSEFLNAEMSRIYRGFTLNVQLGQLRTIQVFVVGQARRPGAYSISSLSTLLNAIFASGGPAANGSVRDIQVKRGDKVIDHFDLYDLLLHGSKTNDIKLATGDVIFIPFVGPQIAVLGSVDESAIYELKGPTTVNEALKLAGGFTSVAAGSTVRLERVFEHNDRSIEDLQLQRSGNKLLENGDIISITSIIDRFRDAVTLRGNVANPGRYVWHPGMHISDLFPDKASLITRNYWRKRNQLGQLQQDYLPDTDAQPVQTEGSLQLHGNTSDKASQSAVTNGSAASGSAGGNSVGTALTADNGVFAAKTDVVLSAPDIDWSYAVIERQNRVDLTTSLIPFNLGKIVLDHDPSQNYELLPGDVVTIFSKADIRVPTSQQTRFVRLEGEFIAAGVYSVLPGETLRDLVKRAGGFTPDAYLYASEFTRESTRRVEQQRLTEYADELEAQISAVTSSNQAHAVSTSDQLAAQASAADANNAVGRLRRMQPIGRIVLDLHPNSQGIDAVPDVALEDGDRFVVPRVPANVNVEGQVYSANAFLYAKNQRVLDYLQRAGGPDREADKKRVFVLRADGSVVSKQYADVLHAPIYPGDTIVVPPVLDKRAVLQRIVDIAQIVGNLGIGIGTIALLSR